MMATNTPFYIEETKETSMIHTHETLLTAVQLSQQFAVTRRSITNWVRNGMPVERLGRALRFDLEACLNWHREQQQIKTRTNGLHEKRLPFPATTRRV